MVTNFAYKPLALQKYEEELEKQRNAQAMQDEFQQWQQVRKEKARNTAALNIHRVWRGYQARKPFRELMGGSAAQRNNARLMDNTIRKSWRYIMLDMLGIAPDLPSDGPMEKVLKTFPRHLRPLVKETVEGEWVPALQMVIEQREHQQQRTARLALNKSLRTRGKDLGECCAYGFDGNMVGLHFSLSYISVSCLQLPTFENTLCFLYVTCEKL